MTVTTGSTVSDDQSRYQRARRRARQIRAFYLHSAIFVAVNILLHVINLVLALGSSVLAAVRLGIGLLTRGPRDLPLDAIHWEGAGSTQDPRTHEQGSAR